jgi:hypothetical protein
MYNSPIYDNIEDESLLHKPAGSFDFHTRETKCTIALYSNDSFTRIVVTAPEGGCYSEPATNTHCTVRTSIQPTQSKRNSLSVGQFSRSSRKCTVKLYWSLQLYNQITPYDFKSCVLNAYSTQFNTANVSLT